MMSDADKWITVYEFMLFYVPLFKYVFIHLFLCPV